MCTCPVTIPNPNYSPVEPRTPFLRRYINWKYRYIQVPCGVCRQCKASRQSNYLQQFELSTIGNYAFMVTLTYKDDMLPKFVMPDGEETPITYYKHITDMLKRLRKYPVFQERGLKYMFVDEYSPKKLRPHYHGIIEVSKLPGDTDRTPYILESQLFNLVLSEWRVNKSQSQYTNKQGLLCSRANTRNPNWVSLCDYVVSYRNGKRRSTYDLHYIKPSVKEGVGEVSYYVTKYFFKENPADKVHLNFCIKTQDDYDAGLSLYKNTFKTRVRKSSNFAGVWTQDSYKEYLATGVDLALQYNPDVIKHLRKCEDFSIHLGDGVYFLDVITNKAIPMARSLRKHLSPQAQLLYRDFLIKTYGDVSDKPTEDTFALHLRDQYFLSKQNISDAFDGI